jgi:hypothetical protein
MRNKIARAPQPAMRGPNTEPELVPSASDAERPMPGCTAAIDFRIDARNESPCENSLIAWTDAKQFALHGVDPLISRRR